MRMVVSSIMAVLLLATGATGFAAQIRQERVAFSPGTTETTIRGKISGRQIVDYRLRAREGQNLFVEFAPTNPSAYFNILPRGSETALFIGSTSGNRFSGRLPAAGDYTLRVYLMRSAARRHETARYILKVSLEDVGLPAAGAQFDKALELQGIRFRVTGTRVGEMNTLTIVPAGLQIDNSPIVRPIDGTIANAEVADLNGDGSPEIYVYVTSAGSGSYGTLVAYGANNRKSLSEIYLPHLLDDRELAHGYMGHDEFAVLEGRLGRRFPLYRDGDINARPTGGMRQIQYRLVPGEAGWLLKVDRVMEF